MARSRRARGVILTTYAMGGFELGEKLSYRLELSFSLVVEALTNSLFGVRARGNIEEALIGCGILDDRRRFPIHC